MPLRSFAVSMSALSLFIIALVVQAPVLADSTTDCPAASTSLDEQHDRLAALAGRWSVKQSFWTSPDAAPAVDRGSATFCMILGSRHLRQNLHIDAADKPFDGLGYIGFDQATHRYFSTWMDINFTGLIIARGDYDAAHHLYSFEGVVPGAGKDGADIPLREVLHVLDQDHFVYEYYEKPGAQEHLAVRLEYARAN